MRTSSARKLFALVAGTDTVPLSAGKPKLGNHGGVEDIHARPGVKNQLERTLPVGDGGYVDRPEAERHTVVRPASCVIIQPKSSLRLRIVVPVTDADFIHLNCTHF